MTTHARPCTNCGRLRGPGQKGAWWTLTDYHKLFGFFCPECKDLVSHFNGVPDHPRHYAAILFKQQVLRQHEKECK